MKLYFEKEKNTVTIDLEQLKITVPTGSTISDLFTKDESFPFDLIISNGVFFLEKEENFSNLVIKEL